MSTHANLLRDLSQSLSAFAYATLDLGLAANVTTFTQSEFSRTTQTNGTGTDHAWGSHQIVLGGAVRGGLYGSMPNFELGGPHDANNRGVWIPTIWHGAVRRDARPLVRRYADRAGVGLPAARELLEPGPRLHAVKRPWLQTRSPSRAFFSSASPSGGRRRSR